MKILSKALLSILMIVLSGCAVTEMSVYKDPEFLDASYGSFVVVSAFVKLEEKAYLEGKICELLAANNVTCKRGIDVFPPTRTFTDEEWAQTFFETNAQALVVIRLTDSYTTQSYVPQTSSTTGSVQAYGKTAYLNSSTTTYGGYTVTKPIEHYEIKVFDAASGKIAFITSSKTKGSGAATSKILSDSLASKFVQTLFENNLLNTTAN